MQICMNIYYQQNLCNCDNMLKILYIPMYNALLSGVEVRKGLALPANTSKYRGIDTILFCYQSLSTGQTDNVPTEIIYHHLLNVG